MQHRAYPSAREMGTGRPAMSFKLSERLNFKQWHPSSLSGLTCIYHTKASISWCSMTLQCILGVFYLRHSPAWSGHHQGDHYSNIDTHQWNNSQTVSVSLMDLCDWRAICFVSIYWVLLCCLKHYFGHSFSHDISMNKIDGNLCPCRVSFQWIGDK